MKVSIITPSYNSQRFIEPCIQSVLNQTYQDWEMLIVDDASPDNANHIIEQYQLKDHRIKLIKLPENMGPAQARNQAILKATGQYIAFLDSDDLWKPMKLEMQLNFMQAHKLAFSYSSYDLINESGNKIGSFATKSHISYKELLKTSCIGCLTAMYDCTILGKMLMPNIAHEDYALWLSILKKTAQVGGIKESLADYRIMQTSLSSNKFKTAKYQWNIYRKVEKLGLVKSCYYFMHYTYHGLTKYK